MSKKSTPGTSCGGLKNGVVKLAKMPSLKFKNLGAHQMKKRTPKIIQNYGMMGALFKQQNLKI